MNKIIPFFTLLIVTFTNACAQCMMLPVSLNQRISGSSLVIEGKVINHSSFWDSSHSNIYTSNLIEVYKAFKSNSSAYVEVITEGGTVGNDKEVVEPSLELSIGDVGVFTLNANALPSQFNKLVYEAYASAQGFIKYNVAENQANEPFKKYLNISTTLYSEIQLQTSTNYLVVKSVNPFLTVNVNSTQAVAAITGFSPTTITAGTFSVLTINGSGFGATRGTSFVEFKRADDGGATFCQPDAWSYVSWSDSQILVKLTTTGASTINSTPGSGVIRVDVGGVKTTSTASLTVQYAHLNVYSSATAPITIYNTRHVNRQAGGYAWQMFTGFDSNTLAKASFLRAFQSWRCGTFINWTTAATTTVNAIAADGINIIRFDVGTELPVGVLGRCSSRFGGCGTQPNQNWYVTELDIVFDDGASWNFGPAAPAFAQYDFESVAVHELGHGHQLGHIINPAEIMNYSLTNGQQKRTLSVNDLAGGNAIMARNLSGGVCANSTLIGLTASNCALGAPTASFTANKTTICAGQTVVFTNLSTGSPTLNTWTFAGGTPSTSTVSSPTVTYNTPGTYSVQLVATNSIGSNTYSVIAYINVTSAASLPVVQDFQGIFLPTNWYTEDSGNDNLKWTKSLSAGALTTTNSALFDNFTTDVTGTRDELKTYVNLAGFTSAKMTFYRAYGLTFPSPNIDSLEIRVSTNCGTSSTQAYYKGGSQISTGNGTGTTIFIPTSAQWVKDSIDLTSYLGQSNVLISFINRANYGDGLYIDQINITGVAAASPTAAINSNSIGCTGTPIIFTDASTGGPTSWLWNTAGGSPTTAITQSVSVTYTTAGVKTITLTVANASGTTTATKSITITATPTVIASITNTTICSGTAVVVSVTGGASSYTWSPTGSGTISTLNPTVTTIYTVTGSNGSCVSAPKTFTINVNTTPTVNIAASSTTICGGQTSALTASGATNYAWLPGGQTSPTIVVTPTINTTYTVTGSNGTCSSSKTITINVANTPTIVTSITNTTICSGTAVVVSVTGGASSYSWSPTGSGTISTLNPTVTTVYTVTGSNGSCVSAPKTFTINVNTTPTVNITASSATICAGQTTTLTASGATNYSWLQGGQTTSAIVVTPSTTTTYTVNGANGTCTSSKTITINVSSSPTIATSITNTTICFGNSTQLSASASGGSGVYSYTWTPNLGIGGGPYTINPGSTASYTVAATDGNGCLASPKIITINVTPPLSASGFVVSKCNGDVTMLTPNITSPGNNGPYNFLWSTGQSDVGVFTSSSSVTANFLSAPNTYTVYIDDGCTIPSATAVFTVNVNPQIAATISNTNASCSSCADGAAIVIASGGTPGYTYIWMPGTITTPFANNLAVGCYTATITDANGCSTSTTTCVSFGTKVDEAQVSNSISIYPNPSNGVFTISATTDNLEITIINTLGQTVKIETMKNSNQMTIDMSKMSKGVYYLQAKISDSTRVFKLILE